jgi:hypothetical protein
MRASDILFFTFMASSVGICLTMLFASVLVNGGLI